jgi:ankyrin repeat protein
MLQALAAPLPLFETVLGPNSRYHWISQHESYTQWIANRSPSLLHIYGSTGTSEASEYIFQTLQDRRSELANEQLPIYFAFDKHDDQRNSLASMLNTLISQILSHKYSLAKSVSISFKHLLVHRSWTEVEMFSMLRSLSTNLDHKGILCVIDGLDVCGTPGKNFLNDLNAYTTNTERHMKFAIVSTANSGLETALAGWPSINIDDHAEDFGTASTRLASEIDLEVLELVQLSPGWSKFEKTIRDYLFDCGHDKHWRCLVLNDFRKSEGLLLESRCRDELDLLKPTSRASTFTRILGKIPPDRQTFARKALSWALYAFRPLSIWEFGIAVSLENHSTHEFTSYPDDFTCQKLVHDLDGLFGGLLVIKEYQLCFGHPDIREFLLAADHEQWYDTRETGHEEITNACFAFISSLQMLTAHAKPPDEAMWPIYIPRRSFCMYAIKYWPRHYEHIPGTHRPTRRASIFLRNMKVVRGWAEAYWWASNSVTRTDRSFISLLPIFAGLGFKDMVKTWLAFDVDEPGSRQDRALALVEAARNAQLEVIRLLLPFNGFDQAILQDALLAGTSRCDEAVLEELITYAATNFETFSWPPCLLCRSAFFGFEKLVRKLLDSGALYDDAITDYGHTPYILAIRGGHLGVVKILLEHKADFTKVTTKNKRLPLSHAAVQGSASIVKVLLDAGADVNSLDSINQSPVHLATIWGKHEAVEVLVEAGADLGSDETVGWSPLTIAADEGYLKCTRLLLEGKANTEVRRGKWTPLRYAGFNKDVEMCQLLLDYKADPNTRGNDSGAPIICVRANGGDFEIVKLLVEHGAAIDGASSTGWTALHNACNNGHAPMVAYLLDHGADIEGVTSNGETPLILALRANMPEVVELLIDSGADVHKTGRWGWAPIHIAQNEEDLTRILLKTSADPNLVVNDLTPLYIAADNDRGGVVKLLLPRCTTATLEFEHKHGSNHYSAFAIAVNNGYNGIARDLLEAGANINFRSNNNNFPLQYPVYSTTTLRTGNAEDVLRVLLEYAPALDLVDDDGDTAMNCVLESTPLGVAKLLVNAGSNLEIRNKEKDTALGKAIKAENFEVAKYLVRKNVNVNVTGGIHGGPLHIACRNLRLDFVKMLVEAGADVDLLDTSKAGTPLTSACGWTALGWNTEQSRQDGEEIVRYLLDYGKADVKILGGQLGCALNAVCGWATPEIIKLLLERGASVDVADPMGRVAIHYAATRTMEHFQPIHGAGADVESRDKMGRTALHWAVIGCSLDILDRVISLSRGFVDQTDNDGWTPLLWAARGTSVYGRELSPTAVKDVITLLLERGADPCVKGAGHDREWTPVKVARYHRVDQSIIRLLISKAKEKPGKDKWDEKLHASRRGTRRPPFCDCCLTVRPFIPIPISHIWTQADFYILSMLLESVINARRAWITTFATNAIIPDSSSTTRIIPSKRWALKTSFSLKRKLRKKRKRNLTRMKIQTKMSLRMRKVKRMKRTRRRRKLYLRW